MTRYYVDTSAAFKLIANETQAGALDRHLADINPELVSSVLLETELRRATQREPELSQSAVSELLDEIALYEVETRTFREAGYLPGAHLRSLDALHLASALAVGADAVLTYDARMTESAISLGLTVVAPS